MKVAIYIEQGTSQLVLTPEEPWESDVLKHFPPPDAALGAYRTQFYSVRGGWIQQAAPGYTGANRDSVVLRIDAAPPPNPSPAPTLTSEERHALDAFLQWGEQEYGKAQEGVFSGHGWAAEALRGLLRRTEPGVEVAHA